MVRNNQEYLSNSLTYVYQSQIGQRVNYTSNTVTASASVANSNLDGTGTLYALTRGGTNGTLIKSVTLKGQSHTTRGMIRFYIVRGTEKNLIAEIEIPAVQQTGKQATFALSIDIDFMLKQAYDFSVSTQNAETMIITAEGQDMVFP